VGEPPKFRSFETCIKATKDRTTNHITKEYEIIAGSKIVARHSNSGASLSPRMRTRTKGRSVI
jgi:hypothetical protein